MAGPCRSELRASCIHRPCSPPHRISHRPWMRTPLSLDPDGPPEPRQLVLNSLGRLTTEPSCKTHGLRNEMYIGSRSGSGTCFVAFIACAERRNFSHIESRGNKVSKMAHQAVSCSTVCLLSSRCATRGYIL